MSLIPYTGIDGVRVMLFVDGENLSIRFASLLKSTGRRTRAGVIHRPNVFVWAKVLSGSSNVAGGAMIRAYYYTAVQGDLLSVEEVAKELKDLGIEAPRVFKKEKGVRSKRVDITLATDMLLHAARHHYDIAVLVAGDEDYVPLVEAVKSEGRVVHLWSIPDGLSPRLLHAVDHHVDLTSWLAEPAE